MEKLKFSLLILVLICFVGADAQPSLPQKAPTPNAASLGFYGDIPVSYYTGNPGISIPLYETTVRGVTLPISLDYDASGVQMNVLPSWTGYNWSLSAGGVITRKINGSTDEYIPPELNYMIGTFHNYFECHSVLPTLSNSELKQILSSENCYDFEPDEFFFNFMGKNGKFYLGNDGQWKVYSDYDIDIIFNITDENNYDYPFIRKYPLSTQDQPKTIAGFKLRDSDGTTYEFGYDTAAIEYTIDITHMSDQEDYASWIATSWYLTKVTDRLQNTLFELTYERGPFYAQPFRSYESTNYVERGKDMTDPFGHTYVYTETGGYSNLYFPYSIQLDAPVYLQKIEAKNGVNLIFERVQSSQSMDSLYKVTQGPLLFGWYNAIKPLVDTYNHYPFYYLQSQNFSAYHAEGASYSDLADLFSKMALQQLKKIIIKEPGGTNYFWKMTYDMDHRMHLTQSSIYYYQGQNPQIKASYLFCYDNYEKLPLSCLSAIGDHWGYYNGKLFPDMQHTENGIIQMRTPDSTKMKYGSLSKITYPTGGSSVIEYEPNDYSTELSLNRQTMEQQTGIGGGLRVKSITEYNDSICSTMLKRRHFSYCNPMTGLSSGELFSRPMYAWNNWVARNDNEIEVTMSTIRSASIVPLSNTFGPAVGYSFVTETNEDGSSKIYHYHNISDGPMDLLQTDAPFNSSDPSPYDKFSEKGYARGKLLSVIQKDSTGNEVANSTYNYRNSSVTDDWIVAANLQCHFGHVSGSTYCFSGRKYKIYHKRYDLREKKDTLFYSDGTQSVMTESYSFGDYNIQMTSPYIHESSARLLQQKNSTKGTQNYTENYYYPLDNGYTSIISMAKQNYFLPVVKTDRYYNGTMIESDSYSYSSYTINGQSQILPNSYNVTKKGNTETLVNYFAYTGTGQPKLYKEINGPQNFISWAYNDNYPICRYLGLFFSTPSFGNNQIFSVNYLLPTIKGLSNQSYPGLFTGYTYFDSKNISSVTNESGTTTFYNFNTKHELIGTQDNNHNFIQQFEYNFKNK